ncbi:phage terminase large subunit family protein [Sphingobium sp. KCTC 72723]|uniref:phage terminase large subunit family protein n=1 Tax=Sphingobium sp. KCTC 72723 TaxID=2733867 RepID=UPI0021D226B2|nr:phage terminase large subunit family protein [Sphingobium sp. KCTC 72723]
MTKTPPETTTKIEALRITSVDGAVVAQHWLAAFAPKMRPKLSQFMCDHARSDDGAKIRPFPFQSDMADAFTDPETSQVSVRKSSRIGYSTILQSFVAWRIAYDPARKLINPPKRTNYINNNSTLGSLRRAIFSSL